MHKHTTHITHKGSTWLNTVLSLLCFVAGRAAILLLAACSTTLLLLTACSTPTNKQADQLNERAYAFHYRNLDSTRTYAQQALAASDGYDAGQAEALNHLAFYHTAKMEYEKATQELDSINTLTDNEIELLIAEIQQMRLCQRQSHNKDFYDHREEARRRLARIESEAGQLNDHARARMVYARSEMAIVTSTYYYYVGLEDPSRRALLSIDPEGELRTDTVQLMAYYYNVGAGGIITKGTKEQVAQEEFENLLDCYVLARRHGYIFWEANALQALSEHLIDPQQRQRLIRDNLYAMTYVNTDMMTDSLLAGNLAQRSLNLFQTFGDVYQTAGSYRTLASCYWQIGDYESALICLQDALYKNLAIEQAPDLVASIHEQLSLVYSAVDDKPHSDEHRNLYLDLHQQTRQDRFLESRAEQLDRSSMLLNSMIASVATAIGLLLALLFLFNLLRRRSDRANSIETLLKPLEQWKQLNAQHQAEMEERFEEVQEQHAICMAHIATNKQRNLEQRAKIFLANSIMPFIDRMLHEIKRLRKGGETEQTRRERYDYITEIVDQIDRSNHVLTEWIQLRQGQLSLQIESFPLQRVFDVLAHGQTAFRMKGITLQVEPTKAVVKADRVLTLFMVNTIADNARKSTPEGGNVSISAQETTDYVEISVEDTGQGLDEQQLATIFDHKVQGGHGFGLMNCRGIIEKYKKISQIFAVCLLAAESQKGKGSRFYFRLPKGVARLMAALAVALGTLLPNPLHADTLTKDTRPTKLKVQDTCLSEADRYADSAYYSNIRGTYDRTLLFADTCRQWLNRFYLKQKPNGKKLMQKAEGQAGTVAEVQWLHDGLKIDYNIILDMRNECAVAALALHQWDVYRYNNKVYTQLFKEVSADRTLGDYCRQMQRSETNKNVAIVLLVIVLLLILPAYYVIYYRHVMHYRYCVERVKLINQILLADMTDKQRQEEISPLVSNRFPEQLQDVVSQIMQTLAESVERDKAQESDIEMADDECRRAQYEDGRLHVSNAILDNCLSTLKHETMYYPSRIRQLVATNNDNLQAIDELATYYKELYAILSQQAMRQVESVRPQCVPLRLTDVCPSAKKTLSDTSTTSGEPHTTPLDDIMVMGDRVLLRMLFDTLQKQNANKPLNVALRPSGERYLVLSLTATTIACKTGESLQLFTPDTRNIPYLLCRQIVRDCGEATNLRGCGITAEETDGSTTFVVTLPKANPSAISKK